MSDSRPDIARRRLVRILAQHGISTARTLEQKISDAGPYNQRIDPHVLTQARTRLENEGRIKTIQRNNAPWFHLADTPMTTVEQRLDEQLPIFQRLHRRNFGSRVGQCLEIAIYRALLRQDALDHLGGFINL